MSTIGAGDGLHVEAVELVRIRIPLVTPFRTSFGTQTERDVLLLRVIGDGVEGWGECVAFDEPLYSSEYVAGAHRVIEDHLLPRLLAQKGARAEDIARILQPIKGHNMAKAAVEMAWLDAQLRAEGQSFGEYLGATRTAVDCGVSVGIMDGIPRLLEAVSAYIDQGYRRIKLKIEPGNDIEPVRAVRERFPDIALQVDANTAYTLADAEHLARLDEYNLLLIEQPLPEELLVANAQLSKIVKTPICLDESITSAAVAAEALDIKACSIINIKAGRVGGYLEAKRIHDLCAERGIAVWCGGMLETGIGRAANVALAALPNFTLPGDTSASDRYYRQDITPPFVLDDGRLPVPTGPGIGVEVLADVLDGLVTSRQLVEVSR
ncbi:MAG TPA: o-succinylbenzoate synthase [Candidatus Dormibacteraeota bacterium]|nr:o-succinylbenzoate synthase [Candidatus Dormibacteraeota bacterium]